MGIFRRLAGFFRRNNCLVPPVVCKKAMGIPVLFLIKIFKKCITNRCIFWISARSAGFIFKKILIYFLKIQSGEKNRCIFCLLMKIHTKSFYFLNFRWKITKIAFYFLIYFLKIKFLKIGVYFLPKPFENTGFQNYEVLLGTMLQQKLSEMHQIRSYYDNNYFTFRNPTGWG